MSESCVKFCFWNVTGLKNAPGLFPVFVNQFDIVGLAETHLDQDRIETEQENENYDKFRRYFGCAARNDSVFGRRSGGTALYVDKKTEARAAAAGEMEDQILWTEVIIMGKKILVGVCYHPPYNSPYRRDGDLFWKCLNETMSDYQRINGELNVVLMGDFNADQVDTRATADKDKQDAWRKLNGFDSRFKMLEKLAILNGKDEYGDGGRSKTYLRNGSESVLDYVLVSKDLLNTWKVYFKVYPLDIKPHHRPLVMVVSENDHEKTKEMLRLDLKLKAVERYWKISEEHFEKLKKYLAVMEITQFQELTECFLDSLSTKLTSLADDTLNMSNELADPNMTMIPARELERIFEGI